jgi:FkbM family methyltransferase
MISIIKTIAYFIAKNEVLEKLRAFYQYNYYAIKYGFIFKVISGICIKIMRKGNFDALTVFKDNKYAVELPNTCRFYWDPGNSASLLGMPIRGDFEPFETNIILKIISTMDINTIFDVGANFGWYSVHMGKNIKENSIIHAFEPSPDAYNELTNNINLNDLRGNVKAINICLGNMTGSTKLYIPKKLGSAFASLNLNNYKNETREVHASIDTIDNYCKNNNIKQVDLIKIDVEGAEYLVFKGAISLLASNKKPVIIMEAQKYSTENFNYTPKDLFKFLSSYGYIIYSMKDDKLILLKDFDNPTGYNFLCYAPQQHVKIAEILGIIEEK